ncbi:MAG TPA: DUF6516 family protein [Candidatus Binatia bacterium]|nr:DUF6516 family protein [Candidatus Binatia bacterium]
MPPVFFEDRDIVGGGRYLQEVRISTFPANQDFPEGIRYSLCLVDRQTGEVVLLYDIHRGKSHHRHFRGEESPYEFVEEDKLLEDFLREVDLIVEGKK